MTDRKGDLLACAAPNEVPSTLRQIARTYAESGAELGSAWQDKGAGSPWIRIAGQVER